MALPRKRAPYRAPGKTPGRMAPLPSAPRAVRKRAPATPK